MRIDNIGYAVKSIEKAKSSMKLLGYEFGATIEDSKRNIYIAFGSFDDYKIELVAPLKVGESPVDRLLSKVGATPYHICYRSSAIEKDVERLTHNGFKLVVPLHWL